MIGLYPIWILVSVICAPFFILYVAARNVYYKVDTTFDIGFQIQYARA